ncbi:Uncharacterised protein [Vibrio cholerae]|nr:Uncharacterised protein [Vibrio cholerae]
MEVKVVLIELEVISRSQTHITFNAVVLHHSNTNDAHR